MGYEKWRRILIENHENKRLMDVMAIIRKIWTPSLALSLTEKNIKKNKGIQNVA